MTPSLLVAGRGYLGTELARQAAAAGWNVHALTKDGDAHSLPCDLSDPSAVEDLGTRIPDPGAIALTASSNRGGPEAYRAVFLGGARHLLATFPRARLLFVSSTSVYGQTDGSVVTEESPAAPATKTSRILLEAEELVLARDGLVARLAGLYGPRRSVLLQRFLAGRARIEDRGRRFLNQIHLHDAAAAILHLLAPDTVAAAAGGRGHIFNICDSTPLTQADCYRALADLFGTDLPPRGPAPVNPKRARTHKQVRNLKLRHTGWQPRYPSFLDAAAQIAPTLA